MLIDALGVVVIFISSFLTEIIAVKQFGKQNDVGSLTGSLTDQLLSMFQVIFLSFRAFHLNGGYGYVSHDLSP
jgi:hypothetical protein